MGQLLMLACGEIEATVMASTSHHHLLPHVLSVHLSAVNSCPHSWIAPQSLCSSSHLLHLLGDLGPYPGYVWLRQELSVLIPFRLPQISCFTLSLKCFSSDSDNCPNVGIRPLFQFPHLLRAGPILVNTPLFPPSSFIVLSFTWFYTFFFSGHLPLSALSWCSACSSV